MNRPRRFHDGWVGEISGVQFRVVKGRKAEDDLVLQMLNDGRWTIVKMAFGALFADFLSENEDYLYPEPLKGGDKYMGYLSRARMYGWETAEAHLEAEKTTKRQREQQENSDEYYIS